MKLWALEYYACPACLGSIKLCEDVTENSHIVQSGVLLCDKCGKSFEIIESFADFTYPENLHENDKRWRDFYNKNAESYDLELRRAITNLGKLFNIASEEKAEKLIIEGRKYLIEKLELASGDKVLEIAIGTGDTIPLILGKIGNNGILEGLDIAINMLKVANKKIVLTISDNVNLTVGNAAFLPYKGEIFDAILHIGGINTFGDIARSLREMARVAKEGAKIVICDEGLSPELRNTPIGQELIKANALFASRPPINLLPKSLKLINVEWIWEGLFYVLKLERI